MSLNKLIFILSSICLGFIINSESLETILSRCCNLGVRWAWENKTCSGYPGPVPNVLPEHQGPCLSTIDACCQRNYRERQCTKGHETAKFGKQCSVGEGSEMAGHYHKDCCEGCKLGLVAGAMGLHCEFQTLRFALGPPWDSSLTKCCLQAGGFSTPKPTVAPPYLLPTPDFNGHTARESQSENICNVFPGQLCSQICISEGNLSYKCACHRGYRLLPDKKSCLADNAVSKMSYETSTDPYLSDTETPETSGRDRTVSSNECPIGFLYNAQTQVCDDFDECEISTTSGVPVCSPYKTCINTIGSFLCEQTPRELEASLECSPGYRYNSAEAICIDIDECKEKIHICNLELQFCINFNGGFDCVLKKDFNRYNCPAGYKFNNETLNCVDFDECQESLASCGPSEICRNTAGAYECDIRCRDGYRFDIRLRSCQDEDECLEGTHDCLINKESCVNVPGSYQCHQIQNSGNNNCPPGYEPSRNFSNRCQDIDECKSSYLNTCESSETCINEDGGYSCQAPSLDTEYPSTEIDEELTDNTIPDSTVVDSTTSSGVPDRIQRKALPTESYRITSQPPSCNIGLRPISGSTRPGEQVLCEDVDECVSGDHNCDSSQICQNTYGSFYCHCRSGYYRDPVTKTCQDLNECQTQQHNCSPSQRCDNSPGSFSCIRITGCGTGYTLNSGTGHCEDDDECVFGNHNCNALGPEWQCKNTAGSFRCERVQKTCPSGLSLAPNGECRPTCTSGFSFNSRGECMDLDECRQPPGGRSVCQIHQQCVNKEGSYICLSKTICPAGYEPDPAGTRCTDVDECRDSRLNTCKFNQQCFNRAGGYYCQCPSGYSITPGGDCEDLNECTRYGGQVCATNSDCYNTQGSFRCICKTGFEQGSDNRTCIDLDECVSSAKHRLCEQGCINTYGSYRCTCEFGFTLSQDGRTCQDVDECSQGRNLCIGNCVNTHGSYKCTCPEGYRLGTDGRTCQDFDECERSSCRSDESCLNVRGGFRCNRIYCPQGYQKEGEQNDRCKRISQCPQEDLQCMKQPLTISRNFLSFTSNIRLGSLGFVDMFTMKGPNWGGAVLHFTLQLKNTRAPGGVQVVTKDHFLLRRPTPYQAVVSLVKPIPGPQDVELELLMEVYHAGVYAGSALAQIVIVVTAYEY